MGAVEPGIAAVIRSLGDTFFPSLPNEADEARKRGCNAEVASFLEIGGGQVKELPDQVMKVLREFLADKDRGELTLVFRLLSWRLGTLLLAGRLALTARYPFAQAFSELPLQTREAVLRSWATSGITAFRQLYRALKSLINAVLLTSVDEQGINQLGRALQYPGPLTGKMRPEVSPAKAASEKILLGCLVDFSVEPPKDSARLIEMLKEKNVELVEGDTSVDAVINCDAVVVGSGAGGGVVAAQLAQAGLRVVVLERGGYRAASDLTLCESTSFSTMYDRGGFTTSDNAGMYIFAGATVGGGTRINWSASFKTPQHVRREWAVVNGLPDFASERYDRAMDAVCKRTNVNTDGKLHSKSNTALKMGLEKLGVHCDVIPRNVVGEHACGHCCMGCPSGDKQDVTSTFLTDACQAGAVIISGVYVDKILSDKRQASDTDASPGRERVARGVTGHVVSAGGPGVAPLRLSVNARIVVSSAGALHTPALLLRSGISVGGTVGANLRLHPATCVLGVFPEEGSPGAGLKAPIKIWEGGIMTIYSKEVGDWEGSGYGAILESPSIHMGLAGARPWYGGASFKKALLDGPNMAAVVVITRDKGSGRVTADPEGKPSIKYWMSPHDENSMIEGMVLGARALVAAGAVKLNTLQEDKAGVGFVVERDSQGNVTNPAELEEYLKLIRTEGVRETRCAVYSAHQLGSCCVGSSRERAPLDPQGECWDVANLYVADGASLPTGPGVNPMISIESTAYMIGEGMAARYGKGQ